MIIEIKVPSPGESITEVEISSWLVGEGDYVERDQEVGEIESDKATLPIIAEESGEISFKAKEKDVVKVGDIIATIDTSKQAAPKKEEPVAKEKNEVKEVATEKVGKKPEETKKQVAEEPVSSKKEPGKQEKDIKVSPVARKIMEEHNLNVDDIINGLKRIGKSEVEAVINTPSSQSATKSRVASRDEERKPMSALRRKLSERLVKVKNETAMLTTFNEVDMSQVMDLRKKYQKAFIEKHDIKLGFMSFFTKAASEALLAYPNVNSMIDGDDIISPDYVDIGIAVQTGKGLMVPILRNTETMSLAQIERNLAELAQKARNNRISIEDLKGGTFTITNGGVFGSLLSTPIINPPQSAILGMHNIVERPVAVNGKVEIRPMMYIALSYDHRIIDGKDSVSFLVKIKELIESPTKMLLGSADPDKLLLEL